jgi:hypothetical protein
MLTHECNNSVQVNQENTSSSTSGAMIIEEEAIQMEKDWKVGDVVRPKAGGPDMCIALTDLARFPRLPPLLLG